MTDSNLTEKQVVVLRRAPFDGFRPGSNMWPDVAYTRPQLRTEADVLFDGEEVDPLVRRGLLVAIPLDVPRLMDRKHPDGFEIEITHRYHVTERGTAALTAQSDL
jgi:hypothetical protein